MSSSKSLVICPVCSTQVSENAINDHLDSGCKTVTSPSIGSQLTRSATQSGKQKGAVQLAPIFLASQSRPSAKRAAEEDIDLINTRPTKNAKPSSLVTPSLAPLAPLAERLRPQTLADFVGQNHLTGEDSLLLSLVNSDSGLGTGSMILWGPPGCGKTTLARLLAKQTDAAFKELSATSSGLADIRSVFEQAKRRLELTQKRTILFVDEIQRFNKGQQDVFLPYVENGWITLIGATTENPSFKLNAALLSRCRVFVLERLTDENIMSILANALSKAQSLAPTGNIPSSSPNLPSSSPNLPSSSPNPPSSSQSPITVSQLEPRVAPKLLQAITSLSTGDARTALSLLELVLSAPLGTTEATLLANLRRSVSSRYDRSGDDRYDMISALHKSVRGSDGSAAMYWLARMVTAGEDPTYIARRLVVMASEDIGLADNHALPLAIATMTAVEKIGLPEARINLAHCVAYLAECPKSTRSYEAYKAAEAAALSDSTVPVPIHLRNAPTGLMKQLGYGREYAYNPTYSHPVYNQYLPSRFDGSEFLKKEGNLSGKEWDESLLRRWELECNGGKDWEGRGA